VVFKSRGSTAWACRVCDDDVFASIFHLHRWEMKVYVFEAVGSIASLEFS